jgi:hypothetical protein
LKYKEKKKIEQLISTCTKFTTRIFLHVLYISKLKYTIETKLKITIKLISTHVFYIVNIELKGVGSNGGKRGVFHHWEKFNSNEGRLT